MRLYRFTNLNTAYMLLVHITGSLPDREDNTVSKRNGIGKPVYLFYYKTFVLFQFIGEYIEVIFLLDLTDFLLDSINLFYFKFYIGHRISGCTDLNSVQKQIAVRSAVTDNFNPLYADLFNQFLVVGINGIQSINFIEIVFMCSRIAQCKKLIELSVGKYLFSFITKALRFINNKNRTSAFDNIDRPFALQCIQFLINLSGFTAGGGISLVIHDNYFDV